MQIVSRSFVFRLLIVVMLFIALVWTFNLTWTAIAQTGGLGYPGMSTNGTVNTGGPVLPPGAINRAFIYPVTYIIYPDRVDVFGNCTGDSCQRVITILPEEITDGASFAGAGGIGVSFSLIGDDLFTMNLFFNGELQNNKCTVRTRGGIISVSDLRV